jgi:uncharacterized protein (DUF488 family)
MIYTIGHGNKIIETFLDELKAYDIKYLVDVRSKPFSKWSPHFNKDILSDCLNTINIKYVNMGDLLGGLPKNRDLYDDGKVVYSKVSTSAPFEKGIQRIVTASNKKLNIAMMCSETDPEQCHRSKLIGGELAKLNIAVIHIKAINNIITQDELYYEMTKGYGLNDLFGPVELTSNKRY